MAKTTRDIDKWWQKLDKILFRLMIQCLLYFQVFFCVCIFPTVVRLFVFIILFFFFSHHQCIFIDVIEKHKINNTKPKRYEQIFG